MCHWLRASVYCSPPLVVSLPRERDDTVQIIKGLAAGTLLKFEAKGESVKDACIQGCIQHVKVGLSILA